MDPASAWRLAADTVLLLHASVVVFVVGGLVCIVAGRFAGWQWIYGRWFRWVHLAAIGIIVLQAWLKQLCPLTILEAELRLRAGDPAYSGSFIQHWVHAWLYWDLPLWVFGVLYTGFGAVVIGLFWADWPRLRPR